MNLVVYFLANSGQFFPYDPMILVTCRATQFCPHVLMIWMSITTTINPQSACLPGSPNCQFLLCLLLVQKVYDPSPTSMPSQEFNDSHKPLHVACQIHRCLFNVVDSVYLLARPRTQSSNLLIGTNTSSAYGCTFEKSSNSHTIQRFRSTFFFSSSPCWSYLSGK